MSTGFQGDAFQTNAFQIEGGNVVVLITGTESTFSAGSLSVGGGINVPITGVSVSFSPGNLGIVYSSILQPSGVQLSASVGSVNVASGTLTALSGTSASFTAGSVTVTAGNLGDVTVLADGIGMSSALGSIRLTGYEVSPAPAPSSGGGMSARKVTEPKKIQQLNTKVTPSGVEIAATAGNIVPFVGSAPVYKRKATMMAAGPTSFAVGNVVVKIEVEPLEDEQEDLLAIMSLLGNL